MLGRGLSQRCRSLTQRPVLPQRSAAAHRHVRVQCTSDPKATVQPEPSIDLGGGDGGNSGNGVGGRPEDDGEEEEEYLNKDQAAAMAAAAGVTLPAEYLATAASEGIKKSAAAAYIALQGSFMAGALSKAMPWFRDRLVYDNRFLFKVGAEVLIDSTCATVAEVRKRGDDFWGEFEFYLSDLMVGLVMDVVLVGLMAPTAVIGRAAPVATGAINKALAGIPSAVFERSIPGIRKYKVGARVACIGVKFLEYSLAGMTCGLIGQGIANAAMMARRSQNPDAEYSVDPPPLLKTALVWGLFMGVSSNLRYQGVFGLERLVDRTIAKKIPAIAYGTTVVIRFANNIVGGENFIDMARFFGVQ